MRRCFQICCKRGIPLQEDIGNIPKYVPEINQGRVIKVYDGDSVTVAAKLHESFPLNRFSVNTQLRLCSGISGLDHRTFQ